MWHFCNVNHPKQQQKSNSLWNWSDQVNLRQLLIEYHIYIFVKIQNAIFKTNLDLASKEGVPRSSWTKVRIHPSIHPLSKQPKVGLNGDQLLHLGWRQAGPLRSHSVPSHTEDSLWLGAAGTAKTIRAMWERRGNWLSCIFHQSSWATPLSASGNSS